MKAVWKYGVAPGRFTLQVPEGAKFQAVAVQRGRPQMWVRVDPYAPTETLMFRVIPTGAEFDDEGLAFLGTFQMHDEGLVFHLFEEVPPTPQNGRD